MRYSYLYKHELNIADSSTYDVFLSGYDGCERTLEVYSKIKATHKFWLVFPQCQCEEYPSSGETILTSAEMDESGYILDVFLQINQFLEENVKLCIDCSGVLIPHMMYLLMHLQLNKIRKFDLIYTAPLYYHQDENTIFSEIIEAPCCISGYEMNCKVNAPEYLIMFAGFNEELIQSVALSKESAKEKHIIIGFPPIEADMYQQNIVQLHKSREIIGERGIFYHKVSAYDPLVSAERLENIVKEIEKRHGRDVGAINIAPLSTKVSAIASALVFMYNPTSSIRVIYPPTKKYYSKQAIGVGRSFVYTIELPEYN